MKVIYSLPFTTYSEFYKELGSSEENVELALYSLNKESKDIQKLEGYLKEKIFSFHGPNLPLKEEFYSQLKRAAHIGQSLGIHSMILHPHKIRTSNQDTNEEEIEMARLDEQKRSLELIAKLSSETGTNIYLETFAGKKRVFRPEEIVNKEMPLVVDSSHLEVVDVCGKIIEYGRYVKELHLSERIDNIQHQPITNAGEWLLSSIATLNSEEKTGWDGTICLEYMPDKREQARIDAKYIRNIMCGLEKVKTEEYNLAEKSFENSIIAKPNGPLGNYCMGLNLVWQRDFNKACKYLKKAINLNENDENSWLLLSYAEFAVGNLEKSLEYKEKCIELNPSYKKYLDFITLNTTQKGIPNLPAFGSRNMDIN